MLSKSYIQRSVRKRFLSRNSTFKSLQQKKKPQEQENHKILQNLRNFFSISGFCKCHVCVYSFIKKNLKVFAFPLNKKAKQKKNSSLKHKKNSFFIHKHKLERKMIRKKSVNLWNLFTDAQSTKNCSLEVGHSKEPENDNLSLKRTKAKRERER